MSYTGEIPKDNIQNSFKMSELQEQRLPRFDYQDDWAYDFNGIYLTLYIKCKYVEIYDIGYTLGEKPMIVLFEPWKEYLLFFTSGSDRRRTLGRIGQLREFLIKDGKQISSDELLYLIANRKKQELQDIIRKNGDRVMKISCSLYIEKGKYGGHYFINSIATQEHITVKFREVGGIVNELFEDQIDINNDIKTGTIGRSQYWDVSYAYFEYNKEIDVQTIIRVLSGRNIKTRGMKVILIIRIGNIEVNRSYNVIKHIEGWEERLKNNIENAKKSSVDFCESGILDVEIDEEYIESLIKAAVSRTMISEGKEILINNLKRNVRAKNVIELVFSLVKEIDKMDGLSDYSKEVISDTLAKMLIKEK